MYWLSYDAAIASAASRATRADDGSPNALSIASLTVANAKT